MSDCLSFASYKKKDFKNTLILRRKTYIHMSLSTITVRNKLDKTILLQYHTEILENLICDLYTLERTNNIYNNEFHN